MVLSHQFAQGSFAQTRRRGSELSRRVLRDRVPDSSRDFQATQRGCRPRGEICRCLPGDYSHFAHCPSLRKFHGKGSHAELESKSISISGESIHSVWPICRHNIPVLAFSVITTCPTTLPFFSSCAVAYSLTVSSKAKFSPDYKPLLISKKLAPQCSLPAFAPLANIGA